MSSVKKNIKKSKTIPSNFYYCKTKFQKIKESLFTKYWQYICDTSQLKKHGDVMPYDFIEGFFQAEFSGCSELPPEYHELIKILRESPKEDLELLLKGIDICDATDLRNEFQAVTRPIDLILGADDGSVPYACHEQIKKLNPNVNLHLMPESQHVPFWTHPEEFKKIIKNILC